MYELARQFFTSREGLLFVFAFNVFSVLLSSYALWLSATSTSREPNK